MMNKTSYEEILPEKIKHLLEENFEKYKPTKKQKENIIKNVVEFYKKISYEPGEAIGVVVAQSISEPATQMSLEGNEKIIVKFNDQIKIVKIGEFVDENIKNFGSKKEGEYEIYDVPDDKKFFVPSLNSEEKIKWKKISSCIRHRSPERLIKIKTRSGRKITATDHHSFVIRKNNKVVPISGRKLRTGDRIPVTRNLPENCISSLNLAQIPEITQKNFTIDEEKIYPYPAYSRGLPKNLKLDHLLGRIIGAYLAEGNLTRYYTSISNVNKKFIEKVKEFTKRYNLTYNEYDNLRGFSKGHDIRINSSLFSYLMKNFCNTGSRRKKVPDFAYSAPEEFVSGLLRGYFDGDGNVSVDRKMIRISSNSEELIDGIKLLLARFKIFSHKGRDKKQYWLSIPYKYVPIFLKKIGSDIKDKNEKMIKLSRLSQNTQDFVDMISGFGDVLYRTAKKLKYPTRYVNNFTKRQKIGRATLYRYIKTFEKLSKEKSIDVEEELNILQRMFNSDVVWDEVVDVSFEHPKTKYVYDISVKGLETFTTFDGIITHNTMRTYHAAGAVAKQVSLGLPRLIEIVDARREPSTPLMKVYLKKEFNNKEDARKIANKIRETKFKNIVLEDVIDLVNSSIEFKINLNSLKDLDIEKEYLGNLVKKYVKDYKVEIKDDVLRLISKKDVTIKDLQRTKLKVFDITIKGIKGITHAIVLKEKNEWVITTLGSNLGKVLKIKEIDPRRVTSNDIREVEKILGIEAARNTIINELCKTLEDQGLNVDVRHLILVGDVMTLDGTIKPIGRYGVSGEKRSVLARANFETTVKHLTEAAIKGEKDSLDSIVENVIVNQVAPIGTNMCDLVYKPLKGDKK